MSFTRFLSQAVPLVLAVILGLTLGSSQAMAKGTKFMVTAPHTPEECLKTLDEVNTQGSKALDQWEWGCMAGDHTGYAILEGKDEAAVRAMLPPSMQNAKIVKLNKFTAAQIKAFHEKK